jgi:hypothetical protein
MHVDIEGVEEQAGAHQTQDAVVNEQIGNRSKRGPASVRSAWELSVLFGIAILQQLHQGALFRRSVVGLGRILGMTGRIKRDG